MNTKIQKLGSDIIKTREKITELQTRLRELEQQKTELENTEIIAIVRSIDILPEDFAAFVEVYKSGRFEPAREDVAYEN